MKKPPNSQPVFGESGIGCTFTNTGNGISIRVDAQPTASHPFRVRLAGKSNGSFKFTVTPGTINGIIPEVYDSADLMTKQPRPQGSWDFDANGYSWLYLVAGNTGSPAYGFPETSAAQAGYPMVKAYNAQQTSSDSSGLILLAAAHKDAQTEKVTLFQFVTGSLWGDRVKVGNNTAQYFFARV